MLAIIQDKKIIILILIAVALGLYIINSKPKEVVVDEKKEEVVEEVIIPKLQIIDEESDTRAIAIMINNHPVAAKNHSGLQDAFIVYEIIVEGGFTRMMAFYRDQETERIGSVRSARHYYLDYALEYDAIYVHFGGSPQAYDAIPALKVDNLDFLVRIGYIRDRSLDVAWEHKAYTSMPMIYEQLEKMGRRITSEVDYLNYEVEDVFINEYDDSIVANEIKIHYSSATIVDYLYENGVYYRTFNGKPHIDTVTEEQYNFKNIVVMHVRNYLSGGMGRQELDTVGTGQGYYFTNGHAVPITWKKDSKSTKAKYYLANGEEIVFNDGNTIFQVVPITANIEISDGITDDVEN